jgi:LmbE family N-acetylglucosaminyl deacetylase
MPAGNIQKIEISKALGKDGEMAMDQTIKSVLAVGAHPDDIEIVCAGTLAKYANHGVKVSIAVATDGSAGHMVIPPKELAEIRRQEAENAAKIIGADFYWMGFVDEMLGIDIDTRLRFVEVIRKAKPDVILTHSPEDYHPDHRALNRLIFDASFMSGLKNVETESPYHPGVQPLYYFDTISGLNFHPTEFVDITDTFEIRQRMLASHQSQIKWLKDHDQVDFLFMTETILRTRGYQCGVQYAEAFRPETVWPRPQPFRVLP